MVEADICGVGFLLLHYVYLFFPSSFFSGKTDFLLGKRPGKLASSLRLMLLLEVLRRSWKKGRKKSRKKNFILPSRKDFFPHLPPPFPFITKKSLPLALSLSPNLKLFANCFASEEVEGGKKFLQIKERGKGKL